MRVVEWDLGVDAFWEGASRRESWYCVAFSRVTWTRIPARVPPSSHKVSVVVI